MARLVRYVQRGGHPAAVAPTVALSPGEKQYGGFLVDALTYVADGGFAAGGIFWNGGTTGGATGTARGWQHRGRRAAVITSRRLILDTAGYEFRSLILVQPNPLSWSVNLYFQGAPPIMLRGPWVPWMTVVMCAELYGAPWPPGWTPGADMPARTLAESGGPA